MRKLGTVIVVCASAFVASAADAQEQLKARHVHPLTGETFADLVPIVQGNGQNPAKHVPIHFGSVLSDSATGCGADVGCGEGCGEGCTAAESDCCLFGSEPLLSCLRNRKSGFSDDVTYSVGGELRHRYMDEQNRLRPGGPAASTYDLWRATPFVSMTYGNTFSGYVQAIDASAFGYDSPLFPIGIDVNRSDLLRYYGELSLGEVAGGELKYRYGRQFLKYGAQHLLSPLGWSNTFRNFEGHKLVWTSEDWTIDAFSMASVNGAAGGAGFGFTTFDTVDSDRQVHGGPRCACAGGRAGVWCVWRGV